jgi:hypothetical protein
MSAGSLLIGCRWLWGHVEELPVVTRFSSRVGLSRCPNVGTDANVPFEEVLDLEALGLLFNLQNVKDVVLYVSL